MAVFTLQEICQAIAYLDVPEIRLESFSGIVSDTRKITPNCLFIAFKGDRFNGEDFVERAIEAGAAGVLVSSSFSYEIKLGATVIRAKGDTQRAYQELASFWRSKFNIPVIAITGSNGKTTTKDLTAATLSSKYAVLKTQGNFNNEIGLPLTILQLHEGHQAAVVEIGMRGLGQIAALAPVAKPNIAIITNVGETHMELLGSIENIARAKGELAEAITEGGTVILNMDDVQVEKMANKVKPGVKVVTFGINQEADVWGFDLENDIQGVKFKCRYGKNGEVIDISLPLPGAHNVYNALGAIAAGFVLGLRADEIKEGLNNLEMTRMRFEVSKKGAFNIINDAYNASPMSMEAALKTLGDIPRKRKIAVLGDMLELGDIAEEAHFKAGLLAGKLGVSTVITLGEMGTMIAKGAREAGVQEVASFFTHEEVATYLQGLIKAEDIILFKGSRGMAMEKIISLVSWEA